MKTRFTLIVMRAAIALLFVILALPTGVWAQNAVSTAYIDDHGVEQNVMAIPLTASSNSSSILAGWYVVNSDVEFTSQVNVQGNGNVNLILADGKTMTVTADDDCLFGASSVTIYGQSNGTGTLTLNATGDNHSAINVPDDVTIYGGIINATGQKYGIYSANSKVTINGGTIHATGQSDNGINGGNSVTINGGTVDATSNAKTGINGGSYVTINGGTVTATGSGSYGYGITASSTGLTVNGGKVTVTGSNYGISAGNVYIYGGDFTATGGTGSGITTSQVTLGWTNTTDKVCISSFNCGNVTIVDEKTFYDATGSSYSGQLFGGSNAQYGYNPADLNAAIGGKTLYAISNDGSEAHPYIISSAGDLDLLATNVNAGNNYSGKFFKLANDITYTHTTDWDDATSTENNYTAIGQHISNNTADDKPFSGTFDGDGHTVSGIRIYKSGGSGWSDYFQGLFGYVVNGTVKNVTLADARITGKQDVGGIVGWLNCFGGSSTIENCHVLGTVTIHAVEDYSWDHGGIAGCNDGSVLHCTSAATLTIGSDASGSYYGGIVGSAMGTLRHNMAIGCTIPDVPYSGAIAGENYYNDCTFEYNYYSGCTVGSETSDIGCNGEDIESEIDDRDVLHYDCAVAATILSDAETSLPALTEGTKVAFRRQFTGGKASTVVFPFDYTPSVEEGKYYTFSGVDYDDDNDKWIATMEEYTGATLAANTPYLFMPAGTDGIVPVLFHGEAAASIIAGSTNNGDWQFKGVYEKKTWAAAGNDYGFAATSGKAVDGVTDVAAGDFVKFAAGAWIRPMRCYLAYKGASAGAPALDAAAPELPSSISVVLVKADGSTTAIDNGELRIENPTDAWHTLDGRRLSGKPTQRGIYINNGKKIVIK